MSIPYELNQDDDRILTEESVRASTPDYTPVDTFNYKMNQDFMYALALSTNSGKDISVLYNLLSRMGKNNIAHHIEPVPTYSKANMSKKSYYAVLKRLQENQLIIKLSSNTFMVNPEMILNFRKSPKADRPQLLALWAEYRKQYIYNK